jgi:hypothetical protein
MILLYIIYALILIFLVTIKLASKYESSREAVPYTRQWMDICDFDDNIIGGFWYYPEES